MLSTIVSFFFFFTFGKVVCHF